MKSANTNGQKPANQSVSISSLLWPAVIIGWAIYRLTDVNHRTMGSIAFNGFLILVGIFLALLALVARGAKTPTEGAKGIHELNQAIYAGPHTRRKVESHVLDDLRLDRAFYEAQTSAFVRAGFREMGDYIDETIEASISWSKSVIRALLSDDGTMMAAIYCVRFSGVMWLLTPLLGRHKVIELESELDDGSFVTTSTAVSAGKTLEFPGISRRFLAPATTVDELITAHRIHVGEIVAIRRGTTPRTFHTAEELFESQDRIQLLKNAFRNSPDFDPAAEIKKIAGKPLSREQSKMAEEAAKLHRSKTS